jgi:peptide/nickel transport system ATP-binding protein
MIFQDPYQALNPQVSVFQTVSEPLVIHKQGNEIDRRETIGQVLRAVGLSPPEDYLHRYPHQLSGGQRQRVAIARAIVLYPDVVVADEPTSMLDASISAHILSIFLDMREDRNVTLVFITHNLATARYLCDRIAVIYRGRLMEIGPAERVIQTPMHPYTQALLDAIPGNRSRAYGTLLPNERDGAALSGCPFFPRCRKADSDRCSRSVPELIETESSHSVACFYA